MRTRSAACILLCLTAACTGRLVDNNPIVPLERDASADALSDAGVDALPDITLVDARDVGGESDAGPDTSAPQAECATIDAFVSGAVTCRDESARCSVTLPSTSTCDETCAAMSMDCLRVYQETSACLPALEQGALGCDEAPTDTGFCQCGDAGAKYEPWVVVTIGDSTMSNRGTPGESGWGDEFPAFGVRAEDVINEGSSGASSLDFETRSNWPRAEALLGPNVFLLIQFGHNDGSDDPNRHTEPGTEPGFEGTYQDRLAFYVSAARAAGATPIIATSMGQMVFDAEGVARDTGVTRYANSATVYAEREGLMLIDGHRVSRAEFTRLGPEETIAQYSLDEVTHFTPAGALRLAELMARAGCIESELYCAQFELDD
ncbi:MAG: GDSL-type esterase/lipase family protein [Polyangiales bacterium]